MQNKINRKGVEFDFNKKNEYLTKICRHLKIDLGAYFLLIISQIILSLPIMFFNNKSTNLSDKLIIISIITGY